MKWAKRAALILIALVIVGVIVYGFLPKPVESEFAAATRGDIRVTIDEEGRTRVKDRFTITAPVMGVISRIALKAGDTVKTGASITLLAPSRPPLLDARAKATAEAGVKSAEATLSQASANVKAAVAEHELARKDHVRMLELLKGKHVSQEQVDQAQTRMEAAAAALESATFGEQAASFQLEMAKAALLEEGAEPKSIAINSPVGGRVLRVYRESEGPVQPGELLVEIGDPGSLEIVADVLSVDAVRVKAGMKVSIERWGGPGALEGEVRLVEPFGFTKQSSLGVEEQRVNVVIDFVSPRSAWEKLGDGYRVEARIIVSESKDVVTVPTGALFQTPDGEAVFVVVDDIAVNRTVEIGARNGLAAEIVSGLKAGDSVIVHPGDDVTDGRRVIQR
jgi:HlyD family secretion protein